MEPPQKKLNQEEKMLVERTRPRIVPKITAEARKAKPQIIDNEQEEESDEATKVKFWRVNIYYMEPLNDCKWEDVKSHT
jgi:hypothetical protein